MLNFEIYKPLFEPFSHYEVSNKGNVRNSKGLILKTYQINSGYLCLKLSGRNGEKSSFLIHRLVAMVFIENENPSEKTYVNHKDFNRHNNCVNNLEWVTQSENVQHSKAAGRNEYNYPTLGKRLRPRGKSGVNSKYRGVYWTPTRNRWIGQVTHQKVAYTKRFKCEEDAARFHDQKVLELGPDRPLNFK